MSESLLDKHITACMKSGVYFWGTAFIAAKTFYSLLVLVKAVTLNG